MSTIPAPPHPEVTNGTPHVPNETGETIDARTAIVAIARGELGIQSPDKYWSIVQPKLMGNPHKIAWCGGFALWCLHEARLATWPWDIWEGPGSKSGFLYRLDRVTFPEPGDIAYFEHGQHHAIVESWVPGVLHTIDGNAMAAPLEGVIAKARYGAALDKTTFYSIAKLIS